MERENIERMEQINQDTEAEIEGIKKFGSENKALVEDMGRKSIADLQLFKSQKNEIVSDIEKLERQIGERKEIYIKKQEMAQDLSVQIEEQRCEIEDRDHQIKEKEQKIYMLKKKTQELEKFKYVLDFKI